MKMCLSSRLKDVGIVFGLVVIVAAVAHFIVTNPLGPSRLLYYVQTPFIQWNVQCSEDAPYWMAQVQRYAISEMAAPASQLAFISADGVLSHCEAGWKDSILGNEVLLPESRFRYASITKTVTAIAIVDLVNKGALSLDDKIVEVLELDNNLKDPRVADITIEHLLTHRGGWDRVRGQDVMFMMSRKPWCPLEPEKLADSKLMYSPGETEAYSNLGYCLLGLALERVTGVTFRDYVKNYFDIREGGVKFIDGPYLPDEVNYDFRHENFYSKNYYQFFDFMAISSSAGLSGNAKDLAEVVSSSLKRGPLTILDGDMHNDCDPEEVQQCYGFGVFRFQPNADVSPIFMHGGKLPGATSLIAISPKGDVLVWLGAGSRRPGGDGLANFYRRIHLLLSEKHYH